MSEPEVLPEVLVLRSEILSLRAALADTAATAEAALGQLVLAHAVVLAAVELVDAPNVAAATSAGEALFVAVGAYRAEGPS